MDHFAGLDVSVKETSICIVDEQTFSVSVGLSQRVEILCRRGGRGDTVSV
jgi:hypothetical protein